MFLDFEFSFRNYLCFYVFGIWVFFFFYKLVYIFKFLGSSFLIGLMVGFISFLKLMCLYMEVQKIDVDTFSYILNFISLNR